MAVSAKQATVDAIKSRRWVAGYEIEDQGGDLRRLRELRAQGYDIKKRRTEYGDYEYRMVSRPLATA
jgi:hypothetical protein